MDEGLLNVVRNFKITSYKKRISDRDFVDRLNDFYSPIILIIFAVVICTKSYVVGNPLQCWIPAHFSGGWEGYTESYCFIKNTYYFPNSVEDIPRDKNLRQQMELNYYQWIPFVLALQAALFYLPSLFWKAVNFQSKIHLKPVIERAVMVTFKCGTDRADEIKSIAEHLHLTLFRTAGLPKKARLTRLKHSSRRKCFGFGAFGSYLTICYFFTKLLFIVNIIIQFYITKDFLHTKLDYGIEMAQSFHNGSTWKETGLFPRVTYCDIKMAKLGQTIPYTLQCVLVINLFNEKIYFFLWFWFLFMLLVNFISYFVWMGKMICGKGLKPYICKSEINRDVIKAQNLESCENDMTPDASFTLQMISANCGKLTTKAIADQLIDFYKVKQDDSKDTDGNFDSNLHHDEPPAYENANQFDKDSDSSKHSAIEMENIV